MPEQYQSLAEFFRHDPGYARFPQEHRSGGAFALDMVRAQQDAHDITDPSLPEFALQLCLKADMNFRWDLGDGWTRPKHSAGGDMVLSPPSTEIAYECGGEHLLLAVMCKRSVLLSLLDEYGVREPDALAAVSQRGLFRDPVVENAMKSLWLEGARNGGASAMMVDSLWLTIVGQLLRLAEIRLRTTSYGLTRSQLVKIDEFVAANASDRLNTADLASLIDLPTAQFTRDFKDATGSSPYQYLLMKRLAKARELIVDSRLSLAEVACEAGFASQSHMTDVFRDKLGVTPGRLRRETQKT